MEADDKQGDGGSEAPGRGAGGGFLSGAAGRLLGAMRGWPVFVTALLFTCLALFVAPFGSGGFDAASAGGGEGGIALAPPGGAGVWGTGVEGGSVFAAVCEGAARSVSIAIFVWFIAFTAGTGAGLCGAIFRGRTVPGILAQLHEAWFCFPLLFLGAAFVMRSGGDHGSTVVVLGLFGAVKVSRGVLDFLSVLRSRAFLKAAIAAGLPPRMLWADYHLTHAASAGFAASWSALPLAFLWEASLGFIAATAGPGGHGLGAMMAEGRVYLLDAPWLVAAPGLALAALIFGASICEAVGRARFGSYRALISTMEEGGGASG